LNEKNLRGDVPKSRGYEESGGFWFEEGMGSEKRGGQAFFVRIRGVSFLQKIEDRLFSFNSSFS